MGCNKIRFLTLGSVGRILPLASSLFGRAQHSPGLRLGRRSVVFFPGGKKLWEESVRGSEIDVAPGSNSPFPEPYGTKEVGSPFVLDRKGMDKKFYHTKGAAPAKFYAGARHASSFSFEAAPFSGKGSWRLLTLLRARSCMLQWGWRRGS